MTAPDDVLIDDEDDETPREWDDPIVIAAYESCPDIDPGSPNYYGPGEPEEIKWFDLDVLEKYTNFTRIQTALALHLERLIAKAKADGMVFVSDGHFGRAKRIQDWLRSQRPVEGGE